MLRELDSSDPTVVAILDRAGRLTTGEAEALDASFRDHPELPALAGSILEVHQLWLNNWAMFDHWARPDAEMGVARQRVAAAFCSPADSSISALEPDDGSVRWGAASAAACAVLAVGRARYSTTFGGFVTDPRLREPWDRVIRRYAERTPMRRPWLSPMTWSGSRRPT